MWKATLIYIVHILICMGLLLFRLNSNLRFSNNTLNISEYTADIPPANYPYGISICANNSDLYGYPSGYSTIITIKYGANRGVQFYSTHNGKLGVRMDTTNNAWTDWKTII